MTLERELDAHLFISFCQPYRPQNARNAGNRVRGCRQGFFCSANNFAWLCPAFVLQVDGKMNAARIWLTYPRLWPKTSLSTRCFCRPALKVFQMQERKSSSVRSSGLFMIVLDLIFIHFHSFNHWRAQNVRLHHLAGRCAEPRVATLLALGHENYAGCAPVLCTQLPRQLTKWKPWSLQWDYMAHHGSNLVQFYWGSQFDGADRWTSPDGHLLPAQCCSCNILSASLHIFTV